MKTSSLAKGGILTGLSVVLLYLASFLQIASWAVTMIVGFIPAVFFLRGQDRAGVVQYLATSLVSLFVLPDKGIAVLYALFFGLYTVLCFELARWCGKMLSWFVKILFAESWVAVVSRLVYLGLVPEIPALSPTVQIILILAGVLLLLYYDFCLGKIFAGLRVYLKRIKI